MATGSMSAGRSSHAAALLLDGRVLVAGGETAGGDRSAELYDPATGKFQRTGSLVIGRVDPTATRLQDGRVLIVGGVGLASGAGDLASAELYDPASGKFSLTGPMSESRVFHTATLLNDGRVLITGGRDNSTPTNSSGLSTALLYDPSTGSFTRVGDMSVGRMFHTATLLNDGRVLVVGGNGESSAEVYDPASRTFQVVPGRMLSVYWSHVATLLSDGRVLVAGQGMNGSWAEIYDPATGTFRTSGSMLADCNCMGGLGSPSAGLLLKDGRVLVPDFGPSPNSRSDFVGSVELFDPVTERFTRAGFMTRMRWGMSMTLLADGRVLFAGDQGVTRTGGAPTLSPKAAAANEAARASAELYVP